jgi:c(7)-type cytochrome triheme protein
MREKGMKKILAFAAAVVVLGACLVISAADQPASEAEPYDEDTYGPEKEIVWNQPVKGVTFSHKLHTMDIGLDCESCHDDLFEMEAGAAEANDDFTMAAMGEGLYCGACHDGSSAFDVNSQCGSCHLEPENSIVWTKPVKAVIFEHKTHSQDIGLDCESCHDDLFVMRAGAAEEADDFVMAALYDGKYCGACHDGNTAFASNTRCTTCHIGVRGYARMTGEGTSAEHDTQH